MKLNRREAEAIMNTTTTRRNGKRKTSGTRKSNSAINKQKVRRLSWFDRFLRTLPFSEDEIRRGFTWLVMVGIVIILLLAARSFGLGEAAYLQYSNMAAKAGFKVKSVETTGMERSDQLKIYKLTLSQMDLAMPMVDVDKIRNDLMKNGWVKEARVTRRLPDTLIVEIEERNPAAVWQRGGTLSLIDDEGVVLQNVPAGKTGGLPTLNGEGANKQAVALAELINQAPSLKPQISGASWVGNRRWDLTFKTGETLALPEGEEAAAKALLNFARMDGIQRLLGRDIIHFDLRDPSRMYLRKTPKVVPKSDTEDKNEKSETKTTDSKDKVSA
jgi:cell division protein FtsQ